jgi:predicted GNAT family N-acyltransferase
MQVDQPEMLERIYALRERVWRSEPDLLDPTSLTPDAVLLRDAYETDSLHWVITVGGEVVAAARLCIRADAHNLPNMQAEYRLLEPLPGPIALLSRLVVQPDMRRQGLSRALTDVRMDAARARGANCVVVEAGPNLIAPFRQRGFLALGPCHSEPWDLVPFILMALRL